MALPGLILWSLQKPFMSKNKTRTAVLASANAGKLKEFQHLMADCGMTVLPQSDFNIPSVDETGLSFVENAILKARHACKYSGHPAIADDSGLEVDALRGEPGIYSARYAGINGDDKANNQKLLEQLKNVTENERTARFQCLLVYMRHETDPTPLICQGTWEGKILQAPSGENGFGYDPLFFVPEKACTSAQLEQTEKNRISHRGIAMRKLLEQLNSAQH